MTNGHDLGHLRSAASERKLQRGNEHTVDTVPLGRRPVISREVRDLIRKMCRENPGCGAARIHGELLKLGIDIGESRVRKYMVLPQAAVSYLPHIPGESCQAVGLHRLLHGAHHPFPRPAGNGDRRLFALLRAAAIC